MERDYAAILGPVIFPLVEHPESIMIRELPGSTKRDTEIVIVAEDDDTARLIGKKGTVAAAIREVAGILSRSEGSAQFIHIRFESFSTSTDNKNED